MQKLGCFGGEGSPKVIGNIIIQYSAYDFLFNQLQQKLCIYLVPFSSYRELFVESGRV